MLHRISKRSLVIQPPQDQPHFPISEEDLAALLQTHKPVLYPANQPLYEFGDRGRTLYIIVRGKVQIHHDLPNNTRIILTELGEREVFGEVAALYDGVRSASAFALESTDVIALEFEDFKALFANYQGVALVIMRSMAHRMSRSSGQMRGATYYVRGSDATRNYTWVDRQVMRFASFLSGGAFLSLFVAMLAGWVWMYFHAQFDPGLVGLALTLSVVQIIFAIAVLNSQNRAAIHEQKLTNAEHYAIMETFQTIEGLRKQLDAQNTSVRALPAHEEQKEHRQ